MADTATNATREEPADCTGGLEGTIVAQNFWPRCGNCAHKSWCAEALQDDPDPANRPYHPAFPHTWEWSLRGLAFPEGKDHEGKEVGCRIVVRSWVGISTYGMRHTGCYQYRVADRYTVAPTAMNKYTRALRLWHENYRIELRIREIETAYPSMDFPLTIEGEWRRLVGEQDRNEAELRRLMALPKGADIPHV